MNFEKQDARLGLFVLLALTLFVGLVVLLLSGRVPAAAPAPATR